MTAALPIEIDCQTVKRRLDEGDDLLLLDVREAEEYAVAALGQSRLLSMSEIMERVSELDEYRDRPIAVLCHLGGRSLRVAQWLRQQGFLQVQSIAGGIDQWSLEIDPSIPRY